MRYQYTGLIPQNIAPAGAVKIGLYDGDGKLRSTIPLGRLRRPGGRKRFSFGLISDLHVTAEQTETSTYFDRALTFFEERGCAFCAHAGDMTNIGFWYDRGDTQIYTGQFAEYQRICRLHSIPVYGICGNHESYNKSITENLPELEQYTGNGLYFALWQGGELFIFLGEPDSYEAMNEGEFLWLKGLLEENPGRRCHVFTHYFVAGDSGSTKNCYTCSFGGREADFKALMATHGRVIHYHGHSHIKFQCQQIDETTNYTEKNGFPSVHIPSVGGSRNVVQQPDGSWQRVTEGPCSQGYIVDVYDDFVVLNGWDLLGDRPVALGTFKIEDR